MNYDMEEIDVDIAAGTYSQQGVLEKKTQPALDSQLVTLIKKRCIAAQLNYTSACADS